jgi:hypothetical protein
MICSYIRLYVLNSGIELYYIQFSIIHLKQEYIGIYDKRSAYMARNSLLSGLRHIHILKSRW